MGLNFVAMADELEALDLDIPCLCRPEVRCSRFKQR